MVTTTLVALWLVALTFLPQSTQSCKGECNQGYRSVCVQRGSQCHCTCVKDVASGARALRELLSEYNVSETTLNEAEGRYKELAGQTSGEFSFIVTDSRVGELTIRGEGLIGLQVIEITTVSDTAMVTRAESQTQPRKKIKTTSKSLRTKKRTTRRIP